MDYRAPKGTADMLPDIARVWEHMQRTAQELFARYGYEPVYTPVFEHTEVFARGIGEATDIVSKEMYTFEDRGGRSITLRPEAPRPSSAPRSSTTSSRRVRRSSCTSWGRCSATSARRRAGCASSGRSTPRRSARPSLGRR